MITNKNSCWWRCGHPFMENVDPTIVSSIFGEKSWFLEQDCYDEEYYCFYDGVFEEDCTIGDIKYGECISHYAAVSNTYQDECEKQNKTKCGDGCCDTIGGTRVCCEDQCVEASLCCGGKILSEFEECCNGEAILPCKKYIIGRPGFISLNSLDCQSSCGFNPCGCGDHQICCEEQCVEKSKCCNNQILKDSESCCGNNICSEQYVCVDEEKSLCCEQQYANGKSCCKDPLEKCGNNKCCNKRTERCCTNGSESYCCPKNYNCTEDGCCPTIRTNNNKCCKANQIVICDNCVYPTDPICGQCTCPEDNKCCGELCYDPTTHKCCNNIEQFLCLNTEICCGDNCCDPNTQECIIVNNKLMCVNKI